MVRDENGPNQGRDKHDNGLVRPKLLGPGRRTMFRAGMAAGMVALAGRARADDPSPPADGPWSRTIGPGVVDRVYGMPSHFEKDVIRRDVPFLTATPQSSVSFTPLQHQQGIITASGVFFERYHAGRPTVDPALHRLMIHGMVEQPRLYTMQDIERFPSVSRIHFIECPANGGMEWRAAQLNSLQFTHGMLGCAEWTGVKVSTILEEVGIKPEGKWALVEGADGAHMARSIPVSKLLDDCMLVYGQNGEALRPEQGYPLRLLVPGWQGNVNVKWIRRIQIGDQPWYTREETSKYTELMPDGKARGFTWPIYAKSVITFPCPEMPVKEPGIYEIRGFAWSGLGKIRAVDVSVDGGINWTRAQLDDLVLPKALTRFTLPWRWDGKPALLQSRAVDETGFVQPTIAELRAVRGTNPIYNNNSIQTWQVKENGSVFDVQLG
jgi:sulfane dehydrogenase subunit SoxC